MEKRIPQSVLLRQAFTELEKELDAQEPDALQALLAAIKACEEGKDVRGVNEDEAPQQ